MNFDQVYRFVVYNKDYTYPALCGIVYLLSGFLAGIIIRIASSDDVWDDDHRGMFRFFCPLFGPLGLLVSIAVYLFWYLPKKWFP